MAYIVINLQEIKEPTLLSIFVFSTFLKHRIPLPVHIISFILVCNQLVQVCLIHILYNYKPDDMLRISSLIPLLLENSHSHLVLSNNRYAYRDFSHYYLHLKHSAWFTNPRSLSSSISTTLSSCFCNSFFSSIGNFLSLNAIKPVQNRLYFSNLNGLFRQA